jgi:hypothetical protein
MSANVMSMYLDSIFMGFVPHNQQEFFDTMKEIIEDHKKRKNDPTMSPVIVFSIIHRFSH